MSAITKLTTGDCAHVLNHAIGMNALDADFMRGEVDEKRLIARVDVTTEAGRKRRYIRVHPEDFLAYVDRYWTQYAQQVKQQLKVAA